MKPWARRKSRPLADYRIFRIRSDERISPRTGNPHEFFVLEAVDWVNVIALTPDRQIVLVEQVRHGSESVELEIPGGMMDEGDSSPVATGLRELKEETGFFTSKGAVIGKVLPNPAFMSNQCFTVLAENCQLVSNPVLDEGEDLRTVLYPIEEIPGLVRSGRIRHSLVIAAFYHFELHKHAPP